MSDYNFIKFNAGEHRINSINLNNVTRIKVYHRDGAEAVTIYYLDGSYDEFESRNIDLKGLISSLEKRGII